MGISEILRQIPDIHFTEKVKMSEKTSLGVGGEARYFVSPDSVHAACQCIIKSRDSGVPYKVIGNGTNLLVSDKGYGGVIISTKNLNRILLDKGEIIALCGTPINRFVNFVSGCVRTGAEGLIGIPATVGGAICQNAGAYSYHISDYLTEVTSFCKGVTVRRRKSECGFGYRTSIFKDNGEFIVSAKFSFPKKKESVKTDFLELRKNSQPKGRTCGSVFKNPPSDKAARLIESAGLKGVSVGGAKVSDLHANFILTDDRARAADVYLLIQKIKREVYEKFGVPLQEEVEYLGEF